MHCSSITCKYGLLYPYWVYIHIYDLIFFLYLQNGLLFIFIKASLYGVYHGPEGLKSIATRIHKMTAVTATILGKHGFKVTNGNSFFDTINVDVASKGLTSQQVQDNAVKNGL